MTMKRVAGALLAGGVFLILTGAGAPAQSKGSQAAQASKEWPTYGHDPGGMRFSPLTQITPANVGQLKVAWVYHMRPPGFAPAARGASTAPAGGPRAGEPQGDNGAYERRNQYEDDPTADHAAARFDR